MVVEKHIVLCSMRSEVIVRFVDVGGNVFFLHKSQKLYIIDKAVASRKVVSFYGPRRLSLQTRKASFSIFYGIKMKRTFLTSG